MKKIELSNYRKQVAANVKKDKREVKSEPETKQAKVLSSEDMGVFISQLSATSKRGNDVLSSKEDLRKLQSICYTLRDMCPEEKGRGMEDVLLTSILCTAFIGDICTKLGKEAFKRVYMKAFEVQSSLAVGDDREANLNRHIEYVGKLGKEVLADLRKLPKRDRCSVENYNIYIVSLLSLLDTKLGRGNLATRLDFAINEYLGLVEYLLETFEEPVKAKEEPVKAKEEPVKAKEEPVKAKETKLGFDETYKAIKVVGRHGVDDNLEAILLGSLNVDNLLDNKTEYDTETRSLLISNFMDLLITTDLVQYGNYLHRKEVEDKSVIHFALAELYKKNNLELCETTRRLAKYFLLLRLGLAGTKEVEILEDAIRVELLELTDMGKRTLSHVSSLLIESDNLCNKLLKEVGLGELSEGVGCKATYVQKVYDGLGLRAKEIELDLALDLDLTGLLAGKYFRALDKLTSGIDLDISGVVKDLTTLEKYIPDVKGLIKSSIVLVKPATPGEALSAMIGYRGMCSTVSGKKMTDKYAVLGKPENVRVIKDSSVGILGYIVLDNIGDGIVHIHSLKLDSTLDTHVVSILKAVVEDYSSEANIEAKLICVGDYTKYEEELKSNRGKKLRLNNKYNGSYEGYVINL